MKFSEAIALGSTVVKPVAGTALTPDSSQGCAIGMAIVAANVPWKHYAKPRTRYDARIGAWRQAYGEAHLEKQWPWLRLNWPTDDCPACKPCVVGMINYVSLIAHYFDWHVMSLKDRTLDDLIEWVRSVEPAEEAAPAATAEKEKVAA